MVSKNFHKKESKYIQRKFILYIILFIYILGIAIGCIFSFKNDTNLNFVKEITFTDNFLNNKNIFVYMFKLFLRDVFILTFALIFKYAGILKSLCICIPFILSIQNACIYSVLILENKISILNLLFTYLIKDTTISLLLLYYCYILMNEILEKKINPKKDIKRFSIFFLGIVFIYFFAIILEIIVHPLL